MSEPIKCCNKEMKLIYEYISEYMDQGIDEWEYQCSICKKKRKITYCNCCDHNTDEEWYEEDVKP